MPAKDHPWDLSPADAIHLQEEIQGEIDLSWDDRAVELIAGADVSYMRRWNRAFASIIVFRVVRGERSSISLEEVECRSASVAIQYPYIPGLLAFREGPALEGVWNQLHHQPDLLIFDGAGIAHPRRCGLAAHLGWRWDTPAIGCAKSRLIGESEEVSARKGETVPLFEKQTRIGSVVRTRTRVKPVYVSPGHRTDFNVAVDWTLRTVTRYKMPEPTRQADKATRRQVESYREVQEGENEGR